MDFENLTTKLKSQKIKVGFFKKGLYKQLAMAIPDDAVIEAACEGMDSKSANAIPVIVTADKVYLVKYKGIMGGLDFGIISRDSITGADVSGEVLSSLTIHTKSDSYKIEKVGQPVAMQMASVLA